MAVEIHEDQPLVEAGAPWIKRFWAPAIAEQSYPAPEIHPALELFGYVAWASYKIPPDFTTLDNLYVVMWPEWTGAYNISFWPHFGQCGELWNVHNQWQILPVAMTLNKFTCYDLVPQFPVLLANLAAGDHLLLRVLNQTAQRLHVYGMDGRYS